jgi:hypothetical protein
LYFLRRSKMKYIKTSISSKLVALLAGAALFGLISQSALALTASGTVISNSATLGYTVGGVAQTAITSAAASFTVDKKVDLSVVAVDVAAVAVNPGQAGAVTTFTVTNLGNDVQDFSLAAANVAAGQALFTKTDNFDTTGISVFVENGLAAGYQSSGPNQDTATYIDELAPGASKTVYVLASIPLAQVNGDAALVSLKATALAGGGVGVQGAALVATVGANTAGVDTVFADAAGSDDIVRNADYSARDAYFVSSAILSVSKTATLICDPANGNSNPKNIPGAAVQYAITITNAATATASATLSQVTDALVAALAFDPKLNSGALPATNCVSGNVANTLSATGFGAVSGTGTTTTTYAAPGLAGQAVTAGADWNVTNAGKVTINFSTLASPTYGLVGGVLPVNSFVTVYFNAFVQ